MIERYRPYAHAWEAVYSVDFTLDQVRRRAATLGQGLLARNMSCVVAYDTRFMGNLFARDLSASLQAQGVRCLLAAAATPLPALHHALDRRLADAALYVSARNRPYFYNGLALIAHDSAGLALELAETASGELPTTNFPPTGDQPADQIIDLRATYLDALRSAIDLELIRRTSITIFVDAMSGTGAGVVPALLGESGQARAIEINREPDPLFGKIAPSPSEAGLNRLKKLVRESDSHLGLAISADGTALAVVDKNGEQLDATEMALLLAGYLARQHRQRGTVIVPVPHAGTPLASLSRPTAWEEATGLKVEVAADAGARIAEYIGRERAAPLLGATAEGELILGRYAACPDGLLAGLMYAELVARGGGSLRTLVEAQREQLLKT